MVRGYKDFFGCRRRRASSSRPDALATCMEVGASKGTDSPIRFLSDAQFTGAIVLSWLVLNLALNFFNKAALGAHSALHFTYPLFYTGCHQLASLIYSSLLFNVRPSLNTLSMKSFRQHRHMLLLLGVTFCINLACNNASLVFLPLSINGLIKSTTPLPTMLFSIALENKAYSRPVIASVVGMVVSAAIAIPYGDNDSASVVGLLLAAASTLAAATRPVLSAVLMRDAAATGLTPIVLVWYDSLISMVLLFITSLLFETKGLAAYFAAAPWHALALLALSSSMAFVYNIVMFWLPRLLGSLTPCILGNARQVVIVLVSVAFVDHLSRANTIIGVGLFAVCCAAYTAIVVREKRTESLGPPPAGRHPLPPQAGEPSAPKAAATPKVGLCQSSSSEHTPLITQGGIAMTTAKA